MTNFAEEMSGLMTFAILQKEHTAFDVSNTRVVGSNPNLGMDLYIYIRFYCHAETVSFVDC
jgi:hypothetical protein